MSDDREVAQTLNVFFTDVCNRLEIVNEFKPSLMNDDRTSISAILTGYSDHRSVLKIKETLKISPSSFKLDDPGVVDIRNATNDINLSKGGGLYDIQTKLLKMY